MNTIEIEAADAAWQAARAAGKNDRDAACAAAHAAGIAGREDFARRKAEWDRERAARAAVKEAEVAAHDQFKVRRARRHPHGHIRAAGINFTGSEAEAQAARNRAARARAA